MDWFSNMTWLLAQWFLALTLSALVGLAIGWLAWRYKPVSKQAVAGQSVVGQAVVSQPVSSPDSSKRTVPDETEEIRDPPEPWQAPQELSSQPDAIDLTAITSERDTLQLQCDRLRSQLAEIEALVGGEEARRQAKDHQES